MARYSSFLGHRVEVQYRASDTLLPASGTFVADSGRSIFLEQSFEQRGQHRHFRWEIPYQCLIRIAVTKGNDAPPVVPAASRRAALDAGPERPAQEPSPSPSAPAETLASQAAAVGGGSSVRLPIGKRVQKV